jgi:predicted regulator of Ras-like GTPase activity (Roadblock/LC7/MglB family)
MITRQSELLRLLALLAEDLPDPHWVALADQDGLVLACVPTNPPVEPEQLSAMTAASVMMGERIVGEIEGGQLHYTSTVGSKRQLVTIVLSPDRLLSIGLEPDVPPQTTFSQISRRVPELLQALQKRFVTE